MILDIDKSEISRLKVSEIEKLSKEVSEDGLDEFIRIFSMDSRKSVLEIVKKVIRKKDKLAEKDLRLEKISIYEKEAYLGGFSKIGGIDEAGRGPLAGPVVAAVVIFDKDTRIRYVDDSKKLSEKKREELFEEIILKARDYGIGIADSGDIDRYNILNATYMAMKRAIDSLKERPDYLLNDAVRIPDVDIFQKPIVKGDSKSMSIAAASILAKVTRDRLMYEYDKKYPGYDFSSNKGYGTKAHYEGLKKLGKTDIHRLTFLKGVL